MIFPSCKWEKLELKDIKQPAAVTHWVSDRASFHTALPVSAVGALIPNILGHEMNIFLHHSFYSHNWEWGY